MKKEPFIEHIKTLAGYTDTPDSIKYVRDFIMGDIEGDEINEEQMVEIFQFITSDLVNDELRRVNAANVKVSSGIEELVSMRRWTNLADIVRLTRFQQLSIMENTDSELIQQAKKYVEAEIAFTVMPGKDRMALIDQYVKENIDD